VIEVLAGLGTRPEAVKMGPVVRALRADPIFHVTVLSTGQHADALKPILAAFDVKPDIELSPAPNDGAGEASQASSRLSTLCAHILREADAIMARARPDVVLVQGDTTSAFALALAAFHRGIPVGHVEAGLRSDDRRQPFPEEANRRFITNIADLHFAPTRLAAQRLLAEGVAPETVFTVGNPVVDAALYMSGQLGIVREKRSRMNGHRRVLVTAHRRENWGELRGIARAMGEIHDALPDVEILLPVHPNPAVKEALTAELSGYPRICLTAPLDYADFLREMATSDLILSDSGGVQEEAPLFGTPVLVMRYCTERPEALSTGLVELIGPDPDRIVPRALELLDAPATEPPPLEGYPFGAGTASEQIAAVLRARLAPA
jgi:UDP-N-acetylglucosamine 2-epimerase (non-hydrolysing)